MLMKAENDQVRVYDPRGVVRSVALPTAERRQRLDGLRLGVLDNSKWNANKLLRGSIEALRKEIDFAAVNYYVKHSFSKDAAPELIEQIVAENDIVLTAIGDCGSCTSGCLRDAIALEQQGVPTAVIVTTEFVKETVLTREALGMHALEPIIIAHPVSSITMEEVAHRVSQILPQAQAVWKGSQSGAAQEYLKSHRTPD